MPLPSRSGSCVSRVWQVNWLLQSMVNTLQECCGGVTTSCLWELHVWNSDSKRGKFMKNAFYAEVKFLFWTTLLFRSCPLLHRVCFEPFLSYLSPLSSREPPQPACCHCVLLCLCLPVYVLGAPERAAGLRFIGLRVPKWARRKERCQRPRRAAVWGVCLDLLLVSWEGAYCLSQYLISRCLCAPGWRVRGSTWEPEPGALCPSPCCGPEINLKVAEGWLVSSSGLS